MPSHPEKPQRRSIRLPDYDYTQSGAYFITICTHKRHCTLSYIQNNKVTLTQWGRIVQKEWLKSEILRDEIRLDDFVIMPNHFHALVWIQHDKQAAYSPEPGIKLYRPAQSLASLVSGFKGAVTRRVNQLRQEKISFWQRNYYEHIVRDDEGLQYLRYYIKHNPENWNKDTLYSDE